MVDVSFKCSKGIIFDTSTGIIHATGRPSRLSRWVELKVIHIVTPQLTPAATIIHLGCMFHPSKRLYVFDISLSNYPQLSHRRFGFVSVLVLELVYDLSIFALIIANISKTTYFKMLQTQGMIMHIIARDGIMYFL